MNLDFNANSLEHLESPPDLLYKYRRVCDYTKNLLRGELFFSSPGSLNDPFEFRILTPGPLDRRDAVEIALEYQASAAGHLIRDSPEWEEWIQNVAESLLRAERFRSDRTHSYFGESPAGVFCLCENADDVRMWSHYAKEHTGICIGLSSELIQRTLRLAKVEYCDSMPAVPLKRVLKGGPSAFLSFLCKSRVWEYESEWRCFDTAGAHAFSEEIVKTVIFGARITAEHREQVMSIIHGYKHEVTVLQANLKRSDYGLDLAPVQL